jgi:hypothetical protein
MSKVMKNRTDNDIKNKWHSMKRREKTDRKREAISHDIALATAGLFEEHERRKNDFSRRDAIGEIFARGQHTNCKMQLFTRKAHDSSEALILPTVTDGGSAENSPIPKKKYLEI